MEITFINVVHGIISVAKQIINQKYFERLKTFLRKYYTMALLACKITILKSSIIKCKTAGKSNKQDLRFKENHNSGKMKDIGSLTFILNKDHFH